MIKIMTVIIRRYLPILFLIVVLFPCIVSASNDSTIIMHVFNFDDDCLRDTLIGKRIFKGNRTKVLPISIRRGTGICDQNTVAVGLRETQLRFPDWQSLSVMAFYDKMNNDEMQDLVLRVKGKVRTNIDTSRFLVIFGQNSLKQLPIIDLSLLDTNANMPLIIRELQKGKQLVEPQKHDLSGGTMWKLQRFDVNIENNQQEYFKQSDHLFSISPNPAATFTDIQSLESMPAGMYDVEVYGANGQRVLKKSITIQQQGDLRTRLDLQNLFSGYYTIRIYSNTSKIADFLFVIIR